MHLVHLDLDRNLKLALVNGLRANNNKITSPREYEWNR